MRHSLSQTIVRLVFGSVGCHASLGRLGLPVAANLAHDDAIFFAKACASGVWPVPCAQRLVLSKQNASSAVCHAPGRPSRIGVGSDFGATAPDALVKAVKEHGADYGVALDGDGTATFTTASTLPAGLTLARRDRAGFPPIKVPYADDPHRPRPSNLDGLRKNVRQWDDGRWHWHWDPAFLSVRDEPSRATRHDHPRS